MAAHDHHHHHGHHHHGHHDHGHHHHHDGHGHESVTAEPPLSEMLENLLPEWLSQIVVPLAANPHVLSFALAFIASLGTFLGGLIVVVGVRITKADPSSPATKRFMGALQAFSAGVMVYITCFDLVPEAVEVVGSRTAMVWVFVGALLFAGLEYVLAILDPEHNHLDHSIAQTGTETHEHDTSVVHEPKPDTHDEVPSDAVSTPKRRRTRRSVASAAATSQQDQDTVPTPSSPRSTRTRKSSIPQPVDKPVEKSAVSTRERKELLRMSFITFVALAMHNLPEGLGVYLSALTNLRLGTQLAVAIMLHNIPEGMAVAIPLYTATSSSLTVLGWTFLNGLAEPLGVIIGGIALHAYLTKFILHCCLAAVGGIMLCISIHELQPTAIKYAGTVAASTAFFLGMVTCFGVLETVNAWFGDVGHHH